MRDVYATSRLRLVKLCGGCLIKVKKKPQFGTVLMAKVPRSRLGKHNEIVVLLLSELDQLEAGSAIKVPLKVLGDTKANVRAALSRAAHKSKREIATAADDEFLYVWNVPLKSTKSKPDV
jgi:hypothetical protein